VEWFDKSKGEPVMVTCNGKPKYEITVREL